MKHLRWGMSVLILAMLTGCLGASDYTCSGLPDGAMCLSVKDTYKVTNNSTYKQLAVKDDEKKPVPVSVEYLRSTEITEPEQAVRSLDGSHAVPVRIPAKIMRVWYGPYEGKNGQASFMPGVGYLELAPRKWVFTKPNYKLARQIKPLSVTTQMKSLTRDHQATGLNDLKPQLPSQQKGKPTTKEKRK